MFTRETLIDRFRRVATELDPEIGANERWATEPVDYFLHAFRPDGAKLRALFEGIPMSDGVLERLKTVYAHAGPETGHMYFMVSRPAPMTDVVLVKKIHAWVSTAASMIDVAGLVEDEDVPLIHRLVSRPPVEIVAAPPAEGSSHPLLGMIYEAILDYADQVEYPLFAELLIEPLYMIACRYELVHWVLRPALGMVGKNDDLFVSVAELWLAGVSFAFIGEGADLRIQAWRTKAKPVGPITRKPRARSPRPTSAQVRAKIAARFSGRKKR